MWVNENIEKDEENKIIHDEAMEVESPTVNVTALPVVPEEDGSMLSDSDSLMVTIIIYFYVCVVVTQII